MTTEEIEAVEAGTDGQETAQAKIENAFASGTRTVGDWQLAPYSASREAAAHTMGLTYGSVDEAGQARFVRTGMYPGLMKDVSIVMWLCVKATEDEIDGAAVDGKRARQLAFEWASANGLFDTQSERFSECYDSFFGIMNEVWACRTNAKKKTTTSQ